MEEEVLIMGSPHYIAGFSYEETTPSGGTSRELCGNEGEVCEIKNIPHRMIEAAEKLNTGEIIFCYRDCGAIRMETEMGRNPYIWKNGKWKEMY